MARLNIILNDNLYKELKIATIKNNTTVSEVIRQLVKDYVKQAENNKKRGDDSESPNTSR